jgi:hypothetical protein
MHHGRFLSADIDPAKETNLNRVREQGLVLIRDGLTANPSLHAVASAAILNDYDDMGPEALLQQLKAFSLILDALKATDHFQEMVSILASLLRSGIYKVDGAAMDVITVRRDAIRVDIDGKSTLIGSVPGDLLTILSLGKESRETERQLMVIGDLVKSRSDTHLEAVSQAFNIPLDDTRRVTLLIEKLFDHQGNFIRKTFEPMLDQLARHGNQAFELLWCYFRALRGRANRVSFLNALQHLISRIKRPKHALRFLLADFCRHPDRVDPSDRNAIMLSNILLRTYNKELDVDIEMTPEEVLSVRNGLDLDVVNYAQFRIDSVEYRFSTKVRTIHETMVEMLNAPRPATQSPSIRHLLFLEREVFIFLSLLSGKTARRILVSALNEYGNPDEGIYRHLGAPTYLPVILQHLKIIVRGVGRVGSREDVALLNRIRTYGLKLTELDGTLENQRSVVRTMEWIQNVIRSITASHWQAN